MRKRGSERERPEDTHRRGGLEECVEDEMETGRESSF